MKCQNIHPWMLVLFCGWCCCCHLEFTRSWAEHHLKVFTCLGLRCASCACSIHFSAPKILKYDTTKYVLHLQFSCEAKLLFSWLVQGSLLTFETKDATTNGQSFQFSITKWPNSMHTVLRNLDVKKYFKYGNMEKHAPYCLFAFKIYISFTI